MDTFAAIYQLAGRVQEIHLLIQAYLGDANRNPLALTSYLTSARNLLDDLGNHVFGNVPDGIFAQHWRSTKHLEESLLALESGYLLRAQTAQGNDNMRHTHLSEVNIRKMVHIGFSDKEIACLDGVCTKTVYRNRKKLGLRKQIHLHTTPDDELGQHIIRWWRATDAQHTGAKMAFGWLKANQIPCTRKQVRAVMKNLRPDDFLARAVQAVHRRQYHVPFPNSLWHIDGNHKLIRWKFVIHGGIDGFSRLVTFMNVSDNNRAATVRRGFIDGAQRFGWPSRVRADYGGENLGVKRVMEATRGINRGSFITGKSVHNQRIERLWRDVRNGLLRRYSETFNALESCGALDVDNPLHLFCLHHTFLPMIQNSLDEWTKAWNYHGISTKGRQQHRAPIKQFHLARALAESAGYHLDFFPYGRQAAEELDLYGTSEHEENVGIADYALYANGEDQEREPDPHDPHVIVDRFAEDLPEELYAEEFQVLLHYHYAAMLQEDHGSTQRQYINCLAWVERCVEEWFPAGRA